jgi:hypothetical protein
MPGFIHPELKKTMLELLKSSRDTGKIKIYMHQLNK